MADETQTNGVRERERIDALIEESRTLVADIREDRPREEAAARRARISLKRAQRSIERAAGAR
jgi:hypothetical protein